MFSTILSLYPITWSLQSWCSYPCGLCGWVCVPSDSLIVSYFSHVPLRSASARIENGWADVFGLWAMGKSGSDIINFSCRCRPPTMGMSLHASYLTSEKLATDPNSSGPMHPTDCRPAFRRSSYFVFARIFLAVCSLQILDSRRWS